ncbi:synaptotagmin-like protein 5 isoform X2 [Anneissia japonica]|uniref:synaptotagmin-like protein 5 isoform X2 n=1 Tax=Anneissia japonica TaxID=1529436 RepID=UPI0014258C8D|nr:synaptotagmin-like protein 5 isoform X2 [Anneissia japonica]
MAEDSSDWLKEHSHENLDVPAEESSTLEDSGDIAPEDDNLTPDDHYEDPSDDPMLEDDLPPLPPPMPPPVPSSHSPELKEPIIIDNDDSEFKSDFSTPLISPFKSIAKTLSFLPSFLRPREESTPPESSPPDGPSSHDLELQLESNGLENEPDSSSEINYELKEEVDLSEQNNVEDYYKGDEEPYLEDNGYEPEYIHDTPEPDVSDSEVGPPEMITRSKSVTFAEDVESIDNKSEPSTQIFSLFRRFSDSLKPMLSPTENEPQIIPEPEEVVESNSTDMVVEDDEWQSHHHILKEDEIEIYETDIDPSEVPMNESPEVEEALDTENGDQVYLQNNNSETLDTLDSFGVETYDEPSENVDMLNSDDPGTIEGNDILVSEVDESQPSPTPGSIPFSLGVFSGFRRPSSNEANDTQNTEANERKEPFPSTGSIPFSLGVFSGFRRPSSSEANNTNTEANGTTQEPSPTAGSIPFSLGMFSGFRKPEANDNNNNNTQEANENQESPSTGNASFSLGVFSGFRRPLSNEGKDISEANGTEESPSTGNAPFSFGFSALRDVVPVIPLPSFPNSETLDEEVVEETERVSGEQEAIVIPDVSVQEVQESGETEPSTAPVVLGGLVASEKFGGSSTSLTSLYSAGGEAYGKIPITGDVQFGLSYNHKLIQFSINVVSCQDLAPVDTKKNKSDPYVKIYLLPDKGRNGKRKTKTKKGTINPQFNEVLRYKIKETELRTRTLSVAVWNHDKLGRNFFLGEVLLPLDDIQFDNYNPKWHQLLPKVMLEEGGIIYKGDITLAIKFEGEGAEADQKQAKSKGSLLVHFKSAKNLTAVRLNGSDPYAKCYLEPDRSKAGKRKTSHIRNNCNPNWDQQVQYDNVTLEGLKLRALHVTVWDHDTLSANDFLGVVSLSLGTGRVGGKEVNYMKSKGEEIRIWEEMLAKPNTWIEATIPLKAKL